MLFPEEDTPLLKAWIVKRLENTSDADPDVLADYMLALLGHDADPAGVRKMCEEEMPDFLGDDTTAFLNDVFEAVTYRSYRPGAPPPPPKPAAPPMMSQLPLPTASGVIVPAAGLDQSQSSGSRKRSFHDDMGDGGGGGGGGRSSKQQRRGGFGARGGRGAMGGRGAHSNFQSPQPFGQFPVAGFDPAVMESIMKMHQMGIPIPPMPGFDSPQQQGAYGRGQGPRGQQPRRRGKCRDYENKGFCTRGNNCMYEHGDNSIFVPGGTSAEEYDPSQVSLMMGNNESDKAQFTQSGRGGRGRGRGGNTRGQDRHSQKQRRGRAPFSADGPINDRSKSTVVIENIPEENFSEEEVRSYFTQFGNIQEVSMQPYKRLAVVKFDNWNSANAAYRSPKVIFDNRFVKVFWYKDDASAGVVPASKGASGQANVSKDVIMGENGQEGEAGEGEAPLDMEEFRRRQEEAQKTHDEKLQKKQELERQRLELEERQRELLAKQQEEKQKLYAKIAAASGNGGAATSETGTPSSSTANGGPSSKSGGQPGSQTEMLRAQLAALEEEAKSLGIDPNAVEDDAASPWPGSFRARGRGRGGYYRARGFAARGARGGGPRGGGGGSPHQAYAAYSLDNRPRRVAVSGVDLSVPERDEALRQHLLGIGDFTDISFAADGSGAAEITFKDRRTAEKFFYGLPPAAGAAGAAGGPAGANAKTIPGVEGQVELSWVANTGPAPAPARTATTTATGDNKTEVKDFGGGGGGQGGGAKTAGGDGNANGDVAMDGDDNNHNGRRDTGVAAHQDQRQAADMDYDVAAEEDFDIG